MLQIGLSLLVSNIIEPGSLEVAVNATNCRNAPTEPNKYYYLTLPLRGIFFLNSNTPDREASLVEDPTR